MVNSFVLDNTIDILDYIVAIYFCTIVVSFKNRLVLDRKLRTRRRSEQKR
jgi:hypothetical protein